MEVITDILLTILTIWKLLGAVLLGALIFTAAMLPPCAIGLWIGIKLGFFD